MIVSICFVDKTIGAYNYMLKLTVKERFNLLDSCLFEEPDIFLGEKINQNINFSKKILERIKELYFIKAFPSAGEVLKPVELLLLGTGEFSND